MTDPNPIIEILAKLPPITTLAYHGLSDVGELTGVQTLAGLLPTSSDPRIATENFTTGGVAVIITATGRAVGPLSAHPHEREIVLLSGTLVAPITSTTLPRSGVLVLIAEEIPASTVDLGLPAGVDALLVEIDDRIVFAQQAGPVEISSPGRFVDQLVLAGPAS